MITALLILNFTLMIVLPIPLGWFIARRRGVGWGLFGIGAATFVASQVGHLPFNWLVLQRFELLPTDIEVVGNLAIQSVFLGLSAGTFEGVARYLTYRYWAKDARTWGKGLMLGAGHGGIEAILLGVLGLINFILLLGIYNGSLPDLVPSDQMPLVVEQVESMLNLPWYEALLGALERFLVIIFHLAASLMVMQVFVRGQKWWLLAAVLWHALLDGAAWFIHNTWGVLTAETFIGVMSLASLGIIFWLRRPEPEEPEPEPLPEPINLQEVETTSEGLDKSRYV